MSEKGIYMEIEGYRNGHAMPYDLETKASLFFLHGPCSVFV